MYVSGTSFWGQKCSLRRPPGGSHRRLYPPLRARAISHVSGAVSFLSRATPKFCLNAGTFRLVNNRHEAQNLTAGSCAGGKLSTMPTASFKYSWYFACSTRPRNGGGREAQNMLPCWGILLYFLAEDVPDAQVFPKKAKYELRYKAGVAILRAGEPEHP